MIPNQHNVKPNDWVALFEQKTDKEVAVKGKNAEGQYVLEGIFAELNVENNNNRIYETEEYLSHLPYLQERAKNRTLAGEMDHPESFDVSMKNISHLITEINYDKNTDCIVGKIELLDTIYGRQAKALVEANVPLHISSRAAGSVGKGKKVSIKKIFTYDLVSTPGFSKARLSRVNESAITDYMTIYKEIDNNLKESGLTPLYESVGYSSDPKPLRKWEQVNESFGFEKNNPTISIHKLEEKDVEAIQLQLSEVQKKQSSMSANQNTTNEQELQNFVNTTTQNFEQIANRLKEFESFKNEVEDLKNQLSETKNELVNTQNYSKKLADTVSADLNEKFSKIDGWSKGNEQIGEKLIAYVKEVAVTADQALEYSKFLAESVMDNQVDIERIDELQKQSIGYTNELCEWLNNHINYTELVAEKVNQNINYTEAIAEKNNTILDYTEMVAERSNAAANYISEHLNPMLNAIPAMLDDHAKTHMETIKHIDESTKELMNLKEHQTLLTEHINQQRGIPLKSKTGLLTESLDTNNLDDVVTKALNEAKKPKASQHAAVMQQMYPFLGLLNESGKSEFYELDQTQKQKVSEQVKANSLYEAEAINSLISEAKNGVGANDPAWIRMMPEQYRPIWEKLDESAKNGIQRKAEFYNLQNQYAINQFWTSIMTERMKVESAERNVQPLNESKQANRNLPSYMTNGYLENMKG